MRNAYLLKVAGLGVLALAVVAADAQEVAEGTWINLFDGETLFGWTRFGEANWQVVDGMLTCEGGSGGWLASASQFTDFELKARIRLKPGTTSGLVARAGLEGHPTENGAAVVWLSEPEGATPGWREVRVIARGSDLAATIDGAPVEGLRASRPRGCVGLLYHLGSKVELGAMRLRPLVLTSIFNGQDLTGWNIIPGKKSVFSVVDGSLNIKNGSGQIETQGVYKDFLLQLEIISNGDGLNSGVFFRGPVGVFWKGYESQIKNAWEGDDRTKPVDFGTGGLYGIQPARKVVSTDREWFQKTIVCDGNHMAVWINGYLVSDYLDTRSVSAEGQGKAGYCAEAGTIHLQGHDPKTDLSFRNIHIQVYAGR